MTAQPAIGHNQPPASDTDALRIRLAEDSEALIRRFNELIEAEPRLPAIADDDTAGRAADYIKQVSACAKALDGTRIAAKEPFLEGGRTVDGFFRRLTDPLAALKSRVERTLGTYLRAKADAERRQREEEARLAREAAAKAEADAMALAETQKQIPAAQADEALDVALQAGAVAAKAEKAAAAKPADMARTRGDYGALATLKREWTFADLDRDKLDLEALRQHFPADGIERAVRAFIKAGGRKLDGCRIFEDQSASVR